MNDAQQLFAQMYQGAQGGAAGPDMGGAGAAGGFQDAQGGADDDVVDGDYREV